MSTYQYEYIDACSYKSLHAVAKTLFTGLVGCNYKRSGENNPSLGTVAPVAGERGYGILQDNPRLADGFDPASVATNGVAKNGGGRPYIWYADSRAAWVNGISRTHNPEFKLCMPGSQYSVTDPIAQSFFVVGRTVILTKIDVYFRNKDLLLPVHLDIRRNVNGVPGPEVIPFSSVVQYPELIITSEDASRPTTFVFNGLVHLEEGEYSVVLRTDSLNYEVWVSVVNELDVQRKLKINTQSVLGSFYKSQNLSTWTPDQLTDLKFTLYRADFDISKHTFPAFTIHPQHFDSFPLEENPLEFVPNSNEFRVYAPGHGLKTGDNVYIDATSFTTSSFVDNLSTISGTYQVRGFTEDDFSVKGNAWGNAYVISRPTRTGGKNISLRNSHNILYDTLYTEVSFYGGGQTQWGQSIAAGVMAYKVLDANTRTYEFAYAPVNKEINFSTTKVMLNPAANGHVNIPPNAPYPTEQNYDTFAIYLPMLSADPYVSPLIDKAKLKVNLIKNQAGPVDVLYNNYMLGDTPWPLANSYTARMFSVNNTNTLGRIFTSDPQEAANLMALVPGHHLGVALGPNLNGYYRVLNTELTGSNANIFIAAIETRLTSTTAERNYLTDAFSNTLNRSYYSNVFNYTPNVLVANSSIWMKYSRRYIDELAPRGGSAKAKYVTREVKFANPSTSIFLKLDVCRPEKTNLRFYYRTKLTNDTEELADKHFEEFPVFNIPTSQDLNEYFEIETQIENLPAFQSLQIKIVFETQQFVGQPPKVKNLRIISLA